MPKFCVFHYGWLESMSQFSKWPLDDLPKLTFGPGKSKVPGRHAVLTRPRGPIFFYLFCSTVDTFWVTRQFWKSYHASDPQIHLDTFEVKSTLNIAHLPDPQIFILFTLCWLLPNYKPIMKKYTKLTQVNLKTYERKRTWYTVELR